MEFDLKWAHMARYELILKLDGALWPTIILKLLLTPKGAKEDPTNLKKVLKSAPNQPSFCVNPFRSDFEHEGDAAKEDGIRPYGKTVSEMENGEMD